MNLILYGTKESPKKRAISAPVESLSDFKRLNQQEDADLANDSSAFQLLNNFNEQRNRKDKVAHATSSNESSRANIFANKHFIDWKNFKELKNKSHLKKFSTKASPTTTTTTESTTVTSTTTTSTATTLGETDSPTNIINSYYFIASNLKKADKDPYESQEDFADHEDQYNDIDYNNVYNYDSDDANPVAVKPNETKSKVMIAAPVAYFSSKKPSEISLIDLKNVQVSNERSSFKFSQSSASSMANKSSSFGLMFTFLLMWGFF